MLERQQSSQEQAREVMKNGGVVIYWRPGCPYCEALDAKLGDLGNYATWVNIWEDPQAEEHVKALNEGNAVVPTVEHRRHPLRGGRPGEPQQGKEADREHPRLR